MLSMIYTSGFYHRISIPFKKGAIPQPWDFYWWPRFPRLWLGMERGDDAHSRQNSLEGNSQLCMKLVLYCKYLIAHCQGMIWGELGGSNKTEENFASMDYAVYR